MVLIERNHMVQTFATHRADHSFAERVGPCGASDQCLQDAQVHRPRYVVHRRRERGIAIMDYGNRDQFGAAQDFF